MPRRDEGLAISGYASRILFIYVKASKLGKLTAFLQYAEKLYSDEHEAISQTDPNEDELGSEDIESEIKKELEEMKAATSKSLFQVVRLDIPCGGLLLPPKKRPRVSN